MPNKQEQIEQLKKLLKRKQSNSYYAQRLGISIEELKTLLKEVKKPDISTTWVAPDFCFGKKVNNEQGTLESSIESDFEPKSDEELAQLHKVDLSKYKISSYWTKQKGDKFTSSLLCTLKKPKDYTPEDFAEHIKGYVSPLPKIVKPKATSKPTVDIELSIFDFHLAKLTLEGETLEEKVEQYVAIATDLIEKVKNSYNIDNIVFPISNDFFHTDNYQNQTTAGTPQDVLTSYDHEYEVGFDLLAQVITFLKQNCEEVHVVLVQGNHDRTKSFYLAHGLEVYFKHNTDIHFYRDTNPTKAVLIGNTFIGYHHGNCKIEQLPLLFSTGDTSAEFGQAKYREIHTGDKHHYMAKEIMGVRIQQMPSLSGTDRWHRDNLYVHNTRSALAICYDFDKGRVAEFTSQI